MSPKYLDGDLVLVLKQTATDYAGQVAVVLYEDEMATIKRVEYTPGKEMKLSPLNKDYETKTITGEALEHCRVLGIPKRLIRDVSGE